MKLGWPNLSLDSKSFLLCMSTENVFCLSAFLPLSQNVIRCVICHQIRKYSSKKSFCFFRNELFNCLSPNESAEMSWQMWQEVKTSEDDHNQEEESGSGFFRKTTGGGRSRCGREACPGCQTPAWSSVPHGLSVEKNWFWVIKGTGGLILLILWSSIFWPDDVKGHYLKNL